MKDTYDAFTPPTRTRFGDNELESNKLKTDELCYISDLVLLHDGANKQAIAVIPLERLGEQWIWLPKSQLKWRRHGTFTHNDITHPVISATMPQWLARKAGLR